MRIEFSNSPIAESFIMDGIKLAISDNDLNPEELTYLKATLEKNNLEDSWFKCKLEDAVANSKTNSLEIEKFLN